MENRQSDSARLGFIEKKVDSILTFLFGDKKLDNQNEGVISAIKRQSEKQEKVSNDIMDKLEAMEKKQIKYQVQTAVMWASLGGTATLIIAYFISQITHH